MAFVTPVVEHWLERDIAQWVHPMKDQSDDPPHHERTLYLWATSHSLHEGREDILYLMMHSTHLYLRLYGRCMVKGHSVSERKETCCCQHIGYFFQLAAWDLLYVSFHRYNSSYHSLCYTSRGALAGMRNSSVSTPRGIDPMIYHTLSGHSAVYCTIYWWLIMYL